jgi:hypothetical protein
MHQGMRNFIKEIEIVLQRILDGYPLRMCEIKMRSLRAFVSMWHDYSRLNKQVKSTCQILRSNESLRCMRAEFCKAIDVEDAVEEEDTEDDIKPTTFAFIARLVAAFNSQLKEQEQSIDTWVDWAQTTVERAVCESYRQLRAGEVSRRPSAVEYWKAARSD